MLAADQQRFPAVPSGDEGVMIRPLQVADARALGDFYVAVPREDFRFYCPYDLTPAQAQAVAAAALDPCEVVLVLAAPDGAIGGYAWYRWQGPAAGSSVMGILIGRSQQGRGHGKAILTRLLQIAGEIGPPVMSLTVQLANPRAVALYRQLGFAVVREQMREARPQWALEPEAEYVMQRPVR